jgi:hypothetical protein
MTDRWYSFGLIVSLAAAVTTVFLIVLERITL